MAQTSGFFQAQWDSSLQDPTTGEYTGWWDRNYIAQQFANYFALFVGNGVFGSPTNQLRVSPSTGLNVVVSSGWAFINGYWYHNDTNLIIPIASNSGSTNRVDSIRLRYNDSSRTITALAFTGDTTNTRGATTYDIKLAEVIVPPNATSISASNITDTRPNESVCGFVKGLMEVETTADLFAQYQAQFNAWFDSIKDQLTGDLAVRLQLEFDQLNANVLQYKADTQSQINTYNTNYQQVLVNTQNAAQTAQSQVNDYVNKDYVIPEQAFVFTNRVCQISDSKVTANSLIDVYFTAETIGAAEEAQIYVDSSAGKITLTATQQPASAIRGMIRVRVRS